jgi:hypothetical protein
MSSVKIVLLLRIYQRGGFNLILTGTSFIPRNYGCLIAVILLLFSKDGWLVMFDNSSAESLLVYFNLLGQHDFLHSFAAIDVHKWLNILLLCIYDEFYWVESVEN